MYLTLDEFDRVLQWKLRSQYGRNRVIRKANTEDVIRVVTEAALSIEHPDKDYEIELRFGILCMFRGVGVPVASAILALVFPERYAVIDFRDWRQVIGEERAVFSVADYKRYLREIRNLAQELQWPVQEVDLAIWEYDRINGRKSVANTEAGRPASAPGAAALLGTSGLPIPLGRTSPATRDLENE